MQVNNSVWDALKSTIEMHTESRPQHYRCVD